MIKKEKRHKKIVITPEAIALRNIRDDKGLSLEVVCKKLKKSEGFLRHIETGRRDFPSRVLLETILEIYDVTHKAFRHRVMSVETEMGKLAPKDELKRLVDQLPEDKIAVVISVVKGLLG